MTLPDPSLTRRVAELERRLREMELTLARNALDAKYVQPIAGRLWLFTLNEDMGESTAGEAAADLLGLDGTDMLKDVTVTDPHDIFSTLVDTGAGVCVEQLDVGGTRYYIVIQAECP